MKGSTWVKIDMRDSAAWPFLSRKFSTRCLLSSDGHFHKIKFILRHATFWKKNKNDMRHFNINMIRYLTPQITHDATHERADNSSKGMFPQCIKSTKIPSCCTMHVSMKSFCYWAVMLYHTQTLNRVCSCTIMNLLRFALTAKNVNNTSLVHLSDAYIWVYFPNGKLRKGKCWET